MPAPNDEFEKAAHQKQGSLVAEFAGFLMQTKKYWLVPLIIVMLLVAGLLILSSSPAVAPFIYTLF